MPAYLNSYVAPPLLAGLTEQGMSAGAAMAFMVAGAVSSVPAMAAVWSLVRRGVFAAYLGSGFHWRGAFRHAVSTGFVIQKARHDDRAFYRQFACDQRSSW